MNKNNSQLLNAILIILGGGMLIYVLTAEEPNKYLQILGFIIIMFGLYRATNYWVETKDEDVEPNEDEKR